eukprot:5180547-Alexandrium_andersonii.AAC.1
MPHDPHPSVAPTPKSWCYSAHPFITKLPNYYNSPRPARGIKQTSLRKFGACGKVEIFGGPDLKGTQSYPYGFGVAITECFRDHQAEIEQSYTDLLAKVMADTGVAGNPRSWPDAKLNEVMKYVLKG